MSWAKDLGGKISDAGKKAGGAVSDAVKDGGKAVSGAGGKVSKELKEWRDNVANLDGAGISEELWGEGGRYAYMAAAAVMEARSPTGTPLSKDHKKALRPHFGDLVDRVSIHWGVAPLDEWAQDKIGVKLGDTDTLAQTFGHDIYVRQEAGKMEAKAELSLLGHELIHAAQYEKHDSSLSKFGYHYFKNYKKAGQNYRNNNMEKEAYTWQAEFDKT